MLGSQVRSKRVRMGVTQEALARKLGIQRHVISAVEADHEMVGLDKKTLGEWVAAIDELAGQHDGDRTAKLDA